MKLRTTNVIFYYAEWVLLLRYERNMSVKRIYLYSNTMSRWWQIMCTCPNLWIFNLKNNNYALALLKNKKKTRICPILASRIKRVLCLLLCFCNVILSSSGHYSFVALLYVFPIIVVLEWSDFYFTQMVKKPRLTEKGRSQIVSFLSQDGTLAIIGSIMKFCDVRTALKRYKDTGSFINILKICRNLKKSA